MNAALAEFGPSIQSLGMSPEGLILPTRGGGIAKLLDTSDERDRRRGAGSYYIWFPEEGIHTYLAVRNGLPKLETYGPDGSFSVSPNKLSAQVRGSTGILSMHVWNGRDDLTFAYFSRGNHFAMYPDAPMTNREEGLRFGPWDRYRGKNHNPFPGAPDNLMDVNNFLGETVQWSADRDRIERQAIAASGLPSLVLR